MIRMLFFGLVFGFVLSQVGASDYTRISDMFLLRDLHLMGVMVIAMATAGIGLAIVKRTGAHTLGGGVPPLSPKPRNAGNWWGGLLFGAGWAITGTCPGTALAQLGEGKIIAVFTVTGILIGTQLYLRIGGNVMKWLESRKSGPQAAPSGGARA